MTNILFLMTDQQRWDALSASGDWVKTPALDRIAAEGVCFTQCVTTTPICMPARLTLATGRYPHNNAVWSNGRYTMPANADNWMREIKKLGYRTSLFGKTHLHPYGRTDLRDKEDLLHAYGLDDVNEIGGPHACANGMSNLGAIWKEKGLLKACQDDFKERFSNKPWVARPSVIPLEYYADVYVGQQAKQYLADYNRDEPWFCWVSFGGPHEPWDAPEPYASMYDPARMPAPATDEEEVPRPRGQIDRMRENKRACPDFDDGDVGAMRANYAGNVSLIDDQIGEILGCHRRARRNGRYRNCLHLGPWRDERRPRPDLQDEFLRWRSASATHCAHARAGQFRRRQRQPRGKQRPGPDAGGTRGW